MPQQPSNQMPLIPGSPRSPRGFAEMIGEYVKAFAWIVFWILIAFTVAAAAFLAARSVIWGCKMVFDAIGV